MLLWMSLALGRTIDDGAGLEPDDDITHRWPCAEVGEPHLLDEGCNLRARDAQRLAHRWAPARGVGGPRTLTRLLAHVCDVSHREAKEDEGERECVLREIVGECLARGGVILMQMREESTTTGLAALSLYRCNIMTSGAQ